MQIKTLQCKVSMMNVIIFLICHMWTMLGWVIDAIIIVKTDIVLLKHVTTLSRFWIRTKRKLISVCIAKLKHDIFLVNSGSNCLCFLSWYINIDNWCIDSLRRMTLYYAHTEIKLSTLMWNDVSYIGTLLDLTLWTSRFHTMVHFGVINAWINFDTFWTLWVISSSHCVQTLFKNNEYEQGYGPTRTIVGSDQSILYLKHIQKWTNSIQSFKKKMDFSILFFETRILLLFLWHTKFLYKLYWLQD